MAGPLPAQERPLPDVPPGVEVERTVPRMGTLLRVRVRAEDRGRALALVDTALGAVKAAEAELSSWDPESTVSRLNRAPAGRWVEIPAGLAGLLAEVSELAAGLRGAFHPAVGPLVDAWGLRGDGRTPSREELTAALSAVAAGIEVDPEGRRARRLHPAAWIDAGAFGKGAALRAAAAVLRDGGAHGAVVDFGGQLLVLGREGAPGGEAVLVGVAHPERRDRSAARLRIADGSVSTSGLSERGGHILDPRSGAPVAPWGSVTVVGDDPLEVDVLSTALFVLGPEEGMRLVADRDDVGALFLVSEREGLRVRANRAMERWMDAPDEPVRQTFDSTTIFPLQETDTCDA